MTQGVMGREEALVCQMEEAEGALVPQTKKPLVLQTYDSLVKH